MDEDLIKNIIEARKNIQKKYQSLKLGQVENTSTYERIFEPIIKPLENLRKPSNPPLDNFLPIKKQKREYNEEYLTSPHVNKHTNSDEIEDTKNNFKTSTPFKQLDLQDDDADTTGNQYVSMTEDDEYDISAGNSSNTVDSAANNADIANSIDVTSALIRNIHKKFLPKNIDTSNCAVRFDKNSRHWKLGSANFLVTDHNKIEVDNKPYTLTNGLCELIFIKKPNPNKYNDTDLNMYLEIVENSNLIYRDFDKSLNYARTNGNKYKYIKSLLDLNKTHKGGGLMQYSNNKIDYVYWDDPK